MPEIAENRITDQCADGEPHHYESYHEPGHLVYWMRICAICRRPDWDDLDDEIRKAPACDGFHEPGQCPRADRMQGAH